MTDPQRSSDSPSLASYVGRVLSGLFDALVNATVNGVKWVVRMLFTGPILLGLVLFVAIIIGVQVVASALGLDASGVKGVLVPVAILAVLVRLLILMLTGRSGG